MKKTGAGALLALGVLAAFAIWQFSKNGGNASNLGGSINVIAVSNNLNNSQIAAYQRYRGR